MQENILKEIINYKKSWLKYRIKKQPLHLIQANIKRSNRNFYHALQSVRPVFILEAKKSSPLAGIINPNFNITKIAKYYQKYATVMSILTDEKYFHGQWDFLQQAHRIIHQPILCKDFFIDPYQVYLARYYKADAILLMLSILNDNEYSLLANLAHNMNMGVLTEINNTSELSRAIKLKAKIIGINNRNLNNLSIDINRTYHLAPLIPDDKIIISESGIKNNFQIKKLKQLVNGFLIGSSIMQSKNIDESIKSIIFGKNKICGLTRVTDAKRIKKIGAIYGGLIFVNNSIRNITLSTAKNIVLQSKLKYIGVFKNEKIEKILFIAQTLSLHAIQLHGDENQEYIINLKKKLPINIQIWKALNIIQYKQQLNLKYIHYYVFDNNQGGSGICFDWNILKQYDLKNVFLSGGLSVQNCTDASTWNCFGLDFNSQVEKYPGIKDHYKLKLLFQKLKYN